jgi:hypothetical protein
LWTLQIQVTGLSDDPNQTALGLDAQVFVSGLFGSAPAFDQTTDWPVLPSSLADGATIAGGALVHFANVYVTNGTLVAEGADQPIVVPLVMHGAPFSLFTPPTTIGTTQMRIHGATLTFSHAARADAAAGVIAGVLDAQEISTAFQATCGEVSSILCGVEFGGVAQQINQAQDILQNGTNASGVSCDGISIGIGFTAALVANPTQVGVEPLPPPDLCDAGSD